MYCPTDSRVVGSTVSRNFRFSDFTPGKLEPQRDPENYVPGPASPGNETKKPSGCIENLEESVKTGDWDNFKGWTNLGTVIKCFLLFGVAVVVIGGVGIILGIGAPVIEPMFYLIKDL